MKILHLRASNFYGGPERQLHLHAREALGTDCAITVGSFPEGGQTPEFLDVIAADGIATHVFDVRSGYDPGAVRMLRGYLRDQMIDVLCTHEYRTTTLAWLAARGGPVRWLGFSRGFTTENLKIRAFHALDKMLIRGADHIVAVSQAQKDKLVRLLIPAERISVVPNAIDVGRMATAVPVDLRQRFGFGVDDFVVVAGGRFSREKGQAVLVEAMALARDPRLRVVMFGDGPDLADIRRQIARYGLGERVLCPGFERNMAGCIAGADGLVNPSLSEGMPNIVLEAMALRRPVVATAVGGVPEILENGRSGWLVPHSDAPALAAALDALARDRDEGQRRAEAAFAFASTELGFARQFERLREVYRGG